jgi:hypothetical protein|tara:strand:- start:129 stop:380 length:252 start_codon:yes stop_codon:yes gene_type:complete
VVHKILNLKAADGRCPEPPTPERGSHRPSQANCAQSDSHPDLLVGSSEFASDPEAPGRCLEEAKSLRGYIETALLTHSMTYLS